MKKTMFMVLFLVSCTFGAQQEVPNAELQNYKIEQLQKTIDELKKDLDEAKKSEQGIESLKERLGDANSRISDIGLYISFLGTLVTLLLGGFGFIAYVSVRAKAKEEAIEAAKKETEEWIKKEGDKTLQTIIVNLETEAQEKIAKVVETAKEEIKNQSKEEEQLMRGNSYYYAKEYNKSIEAYQKAIEINPKSDVAYYNIGVVYDEQGKHEEALKAYQKAIKINPKNDEAYLNMGVVYAEQGKYEEALKAYQKAIEINPKKDEAYANLFELQLMHTQPFNDETRFKELFQTNKKAMMIYEMLKILQGITISSVYTLSQEAWQETYQGIKSTWGWKAIDTWLSNMPESETKAQLLEAVAFFNEALKA